MAAERVGATRDLLLACSRLTLVEKNEIRTRVKKMKRDEMARINLLVERAMALDPRLKRERLRLAKEKREKEEAKKKAAMEREEQERIERERVAKAMAQKKEEEGAPCFVTIAGILVRGHGS